MVRQDVMSVGTCWRGGVHPTVDRREREREWERERRRERDPEQDTARYSLQSIVTTSEIPSPVKPHLLFPEFPKIAPSVISWGPPFNS
jgi:hypothetical protein